MASDQLVDDDSEPEVIAECPWCSKTHSTANHAIGWYFVCCPWTRIVFCKDETGKVTLEPVEEDRQMNERKEFFPVDTVTTTYFWALLYNQDDKRMVLTTVVFTVQGQNPLDSVAQKTKAVTQAEREWDEEKLGPYKGCELAGWDAKYMVHIPFTEKSK